MCCRVGHHILSFTYFTEPTCSKLALSTCVVYLGFSRWTCLEYCVIRRYAMDFFLTQNSCMYTFSCGLVTGLLANAVSESL